MFCELLFYFKDWYICEKVRSHSSSPCIRNTSLVRVRNRASKAKMFSLAPKSSKSSTICSSKAFPTKRSLRRKRRSCHRVASWMTPSIWVSQRRPSTTSKLTARSREGTSITMDQRSPAWRKEAVPSKKKWTLRPKTSLTTTQSIRMESVSIRVSRRKFLPNERRLQLRNSISKMRLKRRSRHQLLKL